MNFGSSHSAPVLNETELRSLLLRYRQENWRGIQTPDWQARIVESYVVDDGEAIFGRLKNVWKFPADAAVLDVGSGVGTFVMACRRRGLRAWGIEPDRIGQGGSLTSIQIARRRTENPTFASAVGEQLPFRDGNFDLITLNQVMEHVADQQAVLREVGRVLKPGGAVYVASPNYLRFYEPHYKIFWLPLLPKFIGRWYLGARRRNTVLLDQIAYTTNSRLRRLFKTLGQDYTVLDLNREDFLRKCQSNSFASLRARLVSKMVKIPILGSPIRSMALWYRRCTEGGCEMLLIKK